YIPPEEAAPLIRSVPSHIWTVGVFVDEKPERVLEIAALTGVTALQFHGNESPEYLDRLDSFRRLKAFKVGSDFRPEELGRYPSAYAFLLDGWVAGGLPGGTGQTFDWSRAQQARAYGKIIVAGGLTVRNVAEAVQRAQPWGVDVCSGVESVPGKKDPKLVREFILATREAERQVPVRELDTLVRLRQTRPVS
ncbi:MAG: phosphoribosylanthranilate isomerase, partial [Terriglobia bacterium]